MSRTSSRAIFGIFRPAIHIRLQGLEPDGAEFVICFDDGAASEFNTLLVTIGSPIRLLPSSPRTSVSRPRLSQTFPCTISGSIQGKVPGDLSSVRKAMTGSAGTPPEPFTFSLASSPYVSQTKGGTLQLADSRNFKVSTTIAAALQTIRPGAIRQMQLASQCRRVAILHQGQGAHGRVQYRPERGAPWISIQAISVYARATTDIMWRTSATPTCNFSASSGHPNSKNSPCRTSLNIPAGDG